MFVWHRPTPKAWQDALTRFWPPQPRMAHLVCWWESGTPEDPTQRYVIYECTPEQFATAKAEAIRSRVVCTCPRESATVALGSCLRCKGKRSPGFRRIKQYLEEHRCVAEPIWIIQGEHGGHRVDYSSAESDWDVMMGGAGTPPEPGTLPYADFDERTLDALHSLDRLNQAWLSLQDCQVGHERALQEQFRTALVAHHKRGLAEAVEDAMPALQGMDLPQWERGDSVLDRDWDELEEHFIKTGNLR